MELFVRQRCRTTCPYLLFFFGAGSEDRCKTESTLYGVEEARIVISEGAVLQTTI